MEINLIGEDRVDYQEIPEADFDDPVSDYQEQQPMEQPVVDVHERLSLMAGSPFRKITQWLVYISAFLLPLWFLPFANDGLEFDKQVFLVAIVGAGLILYLIDIVRSGILRYRKSPFYLPLGGIVLAAVISVIFSVNRITSIFGSDIRRASSLLSWISLAIIFFLAVNVLEDKGQISGQATDQKQTLKNIITSSVILTLLFAVLQSLGLFIFHGYLAKNTFNSVGALNSVGILAAIALPLFLSSVSSEDRSLLNRIVGYARYLGFVLALFLLVLINWWVVWTVAFASLLIFVALSSYPFGHSNRQRMTQFALPLAVIVLGIFLMLVNFNLSAVKNKFPAEVAPTFSTSLEIAKGALSSHPLGYGLHNFPIAYDQYKPTDIANTVFYQIRFNDATSAVITMAIEGGILMLLAFFSLIWFYGKELVLKIKKAMPGGNGMVSVWAAGLGMLVAFFLYPVDMTLVMVFVLLLALVSASVGENETDNERVLDLESNAKYSFLGSLSFIVGLVAVLVAWYFTINNYIANVYLNQALAATDQTKSISLFVKSANSNNNDARAYRYLSQLLVVQLSNDLKNGPKKDETKEAYNARIQNKIASAVNIAVQATTVDPTDSQNWRSLAFVYQSLVGLVGGADQAAVGAYNESLKHNPADPEAYLNIGTIYLTLAENLRGIINNPPAAQAGKLDFAAIKTQINDDLSKAETNFKKAISLYNNYGPALYNLSVVYDRENRLPEAITQFEKLQAANPNDPSVVFQLGLLYYRNGQKDQAFQAWQQAVLLFPNYSNARWYLSLIYEERGDLANALAQVEAIQKLNPDDPQVQQRIAQLQSGKRTIPPGRVLDKQPLSK